MCDNGDMPQHEFSTRYTHLNNQQCAAVDTIDGPLLVVAGPGTGKTELLSMRAANILRQTDVLPENILCLTFTDSGAAAMRQRLRSIIGADAYRVAIHTFHSFGSEVINHHREYFYHGASLKPTDELGSYEILRSILGKLDHQSPLSSKQNGEFTYLQDISRSISQLKQAGLSSAELRQVIDADEALVAAVEPRLSEVFAAGRISKPMAGKLAPLAGEAAQLPLPPLPPTIPPLADSFSLSLARAIDETLDSGKTTPLTAWRNHWCEKDATGSYVLKDRKRLGKLRALAEVYDAYLTELSTAGLYDYDDMILQLAQALDAQPELRANLEEQYQYIMVDEFQDTNLAQLRILFSLTSSPVHEGRPNIMAVGDDDQAIYSFQGADVSNIHRFRSHYRDVRLVALTDNYRSSRAILTPARAVITQGSDRLETVLPELDKTLTAHHQPTQTAVNLAELPTSLAERQWLAQQIRQQIDSGTPPEEIAVLARRHRELVALVPHLQAAGVAINYERRDNILDNPVIQALELLARVIDAIAAGEFPTADSLLPELMAHPAFGFASQDIWQLSLQAWRNRQTWGETMMASPTFQPLMVWLIHMAWHAQHQPLELVLDDLLGIPQPAAGEKTQAAIASAITDYMTQQMAQFDQPISLSTEAAPAMPTVHYRSPLYDYYFSRERLAEQPDAYLACLEALRTLRSRAQEYRGDDETLRLADMLDLLSLHRQFKTPITTIRQRTEVHTGRINLMTAHKAKGLEFGHVYIVGTVDSTWGRRVRSPVSLITYPDNLAITPAGNTYDERLRLFFVAMTRARDHLTISYSTQDDAGKATLPASFLDGVDLTATTVDMPNDVPSLTAQLTTDWQRRLAPVGTPEPDLQQLLQPMLEQYKLSSTHLTAFLDVSRGGPTAFLTNYLLRFPQAPSPHAIYGNAIHHVLQRAHTHLTATGKVRPAEDILGDFEQELSRQPLRPEDFAYFSRKGLDSLSAFLQAEAHTFRPEQKTELSFAGQGVVLGDARLTGTLDLVDIDHTANTIAVTDYKTGKPARSWQGRTDAEKIKLHKYRQQLMFYELLVRHSRDYARYDFAGATLQFIEPDKDTGAIHQLSTSFSQAELDEFAQLIAAVWRCITQLQLPDTSHYPATYKGILAFEEDLLRHRHIEEQE